MKKTLLAALTLLAIGSVAIAWHGERRMGPKGKKGPGWKQKYPPEIIKGKKLHKILAKWIEKGKEGEEFSMSADLKKAVEKLSKEKKTIREEKEKLRKKKIEAVKDFLKATEKDESQALKTARQKMKMRRAGQMMDMMRPCPPRPGLLRRLWNWLTGARPPQRPMMLPGRRMMRPRSGRRMMKQPCPTIIEE